MSAFQRAGSVVDRGTDARISGTPTEIAVHRQIDVMVGWFPDLLEQRDCAHHLAGTSRATQASCTARASSPETPSIVVTSLLPSAEIGSEQARNGLPSINTV